MSTKLTLLADAGRNVHGQKLVRVSCSCGSPPFEVREDSFKQGRSTSCGFCRKGGKRKPAPVPVPEAEQQKQTPEVENVFRQGTPQWYAEEIASREATATSAENRARFLRLYLSEQTTTDLDAIKKWTAESTLSRKLREEIARFRIEMAKAETATKKDERTQAERTREKIAALRGEL